MLTTFKHFLTDDSGAITVDWVVLTAGMVGLGIAVMATVSGGIEDMSGEIATSVVVANPLTPGVVFLDANQLTAGSLD